MKTILILLITTFFTAPVFAQQFDNENDEEETLFGSNPRITGYGGPEVKMSRVMGNWELIMGGRGGTIVNSQFSFGGAFYLMLTSPRLDNTQSVYQYNDDYLRMLYGGLFLEYTISSSKLVHLTINTLVGAGGAAVTGPLSYDHHDSDDWINEASAFFVAEPGATIELNIASPFRIAAGAGYRFVSGLNLDNISNADLSGPTINLTFKFGQF